MPDKSARPRLFGDTFELVNYNISRVTAQPDDEITAWLDWRAVRPPDENYAVCVHLLEGETTLRGQVDGDPSHLGRTVATSLWATDTLIYDTHSFTIFPDTPPGRYQLKIGLYSRESLERLPVTLGDGTIADGLVLATIDVR